MGQRETALAFRRLFLNEDGTYTPDGELVMRDMEAACAWLRSTLPVDDGGRVDPLATAAELSKRGIYSHMKMRLHGKLPPEKEIK